MGKDLFEGSRAAREVFEEIDDALNRKLTTVIFDGPEDELRRTENTQPAIMAVSLACLKAIEEEAGEAVTPALYAGHSLGEYTALAASGALSTADTARLVVERGRLMQLACDERPGGMAALIGIDELAVADVCRETGTTMANVNNAQQIVISGDHMDLARAVDLASARGAKKCVLLKVGGAFHSPLMEPAQASLAEAIDSMPFCDPAAPIVGNVDALPHSTAADVRKALTAHLMSCVQWTRSVDCMTAQGVDEFVEIGPGKVLTGLMRRINRKAAVATVGDLDSVREFAA